MFGNHFGAASFAASPSSEVEPAPAIVLVVEDVVLVRTVVTAYLREAGFQVIEATKRGRMRYNVRVASRALMSERTGVPGRLQELRASARRARRLAAGLLGEDADRLIRYAEQLEQQATDLARATEINSPPSPAPANVQMQVQQQQQQQSEVEPSNDPEAKPKG
jgi:hypothetical protein